MKPTIVLIFLLASLGIVSAVITVSFSEWPRLVEKSPDIVLARCTKGPPEGAVGDLMRPDVEIISVLKGRTNLGTARVQSLYWIEPGKQYLIFAQFHDGFYQAIEEYRFISLDPSFSTNLISGKSLDEQIGIIIKRRLAFLEQELEQKRAEKQRLDAW